MSGRNWQKRAAVETAGFGLGTAAGLFAGQAVVSSAAGLGVALLATPIGWVIIIGAAITVGIIAAKSGDMAGKFVANKAFDVGTRFNSL